MQIFQFYLIVGIVLIALEMVAPGFVLAPLGVAAIATSGVAWLTNNLLLQGLTFAAVSAALFVGIRAWNTFHPQSSSEKGTFGLVGQTGVLLERPESADRPGRIKIFSDVFEILWDDSPELEAVRSLEPGQRVRVSRVLGNRVVVHRAQGG